MTKDKIVLGQGRLYHGNRLLGVTSDKPAPERVEVRSFSVHIPVPPHSGAALAMAFGRDPIPFLVGYEPQMLLPDLRTPAKRMIDEIYGTNYYPYLADLFPRDIGDETITFFEPKMPLAEVFAAEMTAVVEASRASRMQIVFVDPALVSTKLIRRAEITDYDAIDELLDLKNDLVEATKKAVGVAFDQIAKDVVTGRFRSYLDHDPTKNTRRRRRK